MTLGRNTEGRDLRTRLLIVGAAFGVGLLILAINLYRLMVVRYDEFAALSQDNQYKDVRIRAPRGEIRDYRGEVLVDGRPSFDVFITPAFCLRCATEVLPRLAEWLEWDEVKRARIEQALKSAHKAQRYQPMPVQVDLPRDKLDFLSVRLFTLAGVTIEPISRRNYRTGSAMAHVLGYMSEVTAEELESLNKLPADADGSRASPYYLGEAKGRRGLERAFESSLRGNDGLRKEVVNARGEAMRDPSGRVIGTEVSAPVSGSNLVLSIDARLQAEAEAVFPGQAGALIAMDAQTGFIRAIVSRPSFDSNLMSRGVTGEQMAAFAADPLQPMVFRAGAEHYHPGSTFKPITLLAGLQSGSFTSHSMVNCPGGYRLGNRVWRCHKDSGHGLVNARDALQKSCDTYFYRIADTIGIDPIASVGRLFGMGAKTELEVAAEVPGVMPDSAYHQKVTPGGYTKGMALNTAIGQGDVNMTPLQMAVMYAALGNGGAVYKPQLVLRVEKPDGVVKESFEPKLVRQVPMTPEQHHLIVDSLTAVVNEPGGTAFRSRLSNVVVAGKTGTAQVSRLGAVRLKKEQMDYFERDHAWFASFAPAEHAELVVIVLNEHGGHGGSDAAPAAAAVLKKYFELKALDAARVIQADGGTLAQTDMPTVWPQDGKDGGTGLWAATKPVVARLETRKVDAGTLSQPVVVPDIADAGSAPEAGALSLDGGLTSLAGELEPAPGP